jgi:hypothetical protein
MNGSGYKKDSVRNNMNKLENNSNTYSDCLIDTTSQWTYVNIPKNASTYLKHYFKEILNFEHADLNQLNNNRKYIIFLRDPIDRWFSGITEYIYRHELVENNDYKYIFEEKIFDEHTLPQYDFIPITEVDNIYFFNVDDIHTIFSDFFLKTFNKEFIKADFWQNSTKENTTKVEIMNKIKHHYKLNKTKLYNEFLDIYKNDYYLLNNFMRKIV